MLATILKTPTATKISIKIIDAFASMRHLLSNGLLENTIGHKLLEYDNRTKHINVIKY